MKDPKTTIAGLALSLGAALSASPDPVWHSIGFVIAILGPAVLGYLAKDSATTTK